MTYTEGCLSIPGEAEDVERAAKVWVRALDYDGKPFEIDAEGDLLAIALQHELDHLDGTRVRRPPLEPQARAHPAADEEAEGRARDRERGRGPARDAARVGAVARRPAALEPLVDGPVRHLVRGAFSSRGMWRTSMSAKPLSRASRLVVQRPQVVGLHRVLAGELLHQQLAVGAARRAP